MTGPDAATTLSFQQLNDKLDDYVAQEFTPRPGAVERWSLWVGLAGAAVGLGLGWMFDDKAGLVLALAGLVVEVGGFAISLSLMVIREWKSIRHARKTYAKELDHDYALYRSLIVELQKYPWAERETRLRYIRDRQRIMTRRVGLFAGGLEKLGVIPLLVGLYFQFKNWEWDNWEALGDVNLVQGLLVWALFVSYAVVWQAIRLRDRVESFEMLLAEANSEK